MQIKWFSSEDGSVASQPGDASIIWLSILMHWLTKRNSQILYHISLPRFYFHLFSLFSFPDTVKRQKTDTFREHLQKYFRILMTFWEHPQMTTLENLGNCWHFWQLRTSKHYNHSDLTIKSDTGQHSHFLPCLDINCNGSVLKITSESLAVTLDNIWNDCDIWHYYPITRPLRVVFFYFESSSSRVVVKSSSTESSTE